MGCAMVYRSPLNLALPTIVSAIRPVTVGQTVGYYTDHKWEEIRVLQSL